MKQSAMNAVFPMGREEKGYSPVRILFLMGVSGSGKTMIGIRRRAVLVFRQVE